MGPESLFGFSSGLHLFPAYMLLNTMRLSFLISQVGIVIPSLDIDGDYEDTWAHIGKAQNA